MRRRVRLERIKIPRIF